MAVLCLGNAAQVHPTRRLSPLVTSPDGARNLGNLITLTGRDLHC